MVKKIRRNNNKTNLVVKHNKDGKLMVVKRHDIKSKEDRYVEEHHEGSIGVTKKEFMDLLAKASQPVSYEPQSDLEKPET